MQIAAGITELPQQFEVQTSPEIPGEKPTEISICRLKAEEWKGLRDKMDRDGYERNSTRKRQRLGGLACISSTYYCRPLIPITGITCLLTTAYLQVVACLRKIASVFLNLVLDLRLNGWRSR